MTAAKAAKSVRITREIVCVGMAETKDGKLMPEFREVLDGDKVDDRVRGWGKVRASAGSCYSIDADGEDEWAAGTAYVPKNGRLPMTRLFPDRDKRAAWQATADAVTARHRSAKMLGDQERKREIRELCAPLAAVYRRLSWNDRSAFLIAVQELIVRNGLRDGAA